MRIHSLNFQLQAMFIFVAFVSLVVLGILFQITQEISDKTNQLSKSAELNSLIKEWETELIIGTRSRITFLSLQKNVFLKNYQNSIERVDGLNRAIRNLREDFDEMVQDSLDMLYEQHQKYKTLAATLEGQRLSTKQLRQNGVLLEQMEGEIKEALQNFQLAMTKVRSEKLETMGETIASSRQLVLLAMGSFLIINLLIWWLLKWKILSPLKVLEEGVRRIGEGELGLQMEVRTKNEIRDLVDVLNKMSTQLKKNQDTEVKLQKLETIGQVVTSVNHEINNPLMIISGNAEYLGKMYGNKNEIFHRKINVIIKEVRRIFEVTQKLKDIREPEVDTYVGEQKTMIDLKRSR